MRTIFVVVNGKPRAGKDEFCKQAVNYLKNMTQDGQIYSTITTCVQMAEIAGYKTYYDESVPKTPDNRAMLSELKDWYTKWFDGTFFEMIRLIDHSIVKHSGLPEAEKFNFIFAMIREPVEIEKIKNYCRANRIFFSSILGSGPRQEIGESCHSDRNVDNYTYEHYYKNDGTIDDLAEKAKVFVKSLIAEYFEFEADLSQSIKPVTNEITNSATHL